MHEDSLDAHVILAVYMLQLHWAQQGNMDQEAASVFEEQPMESQGDAGMVSSICAAEIVHAILHESAGFFGLMAVSSSTGKVVGKALQTKVLPAQSP